MNIAKAQKAIFNELLKGNFRMRRFAIDEHYVSITPDGYMAYIFPASTVYFRLERIEEMPPVPVFEIIKPENELKLLPDLRLDERRHMMYRRLYKPGKNVFVNVKFLECFQNPKFYQAENPHSSIIVTESIGRGTKTTGETPVGLVLPIRSSWDDGTYYGTVEGV